MTERDPALEPFDALIGTWATEATHPEFDGVVPGSVSFEWLQGGHFLIQRSRNEHELFPDAISVIGAPESGDGFVLEYFDSRGVRRTYGVSLDDGVLRMWRDAAGFDQRFSATLGRDEFEGRWQLARTPGDWQDDVQLTYRRHARRSEELAAIARTVIDSNQFMTIGTADGDGVPWVAPVWYAPVEYREFFWVSDPRARHSVNLAARPEVAIVIFDSHQAGGWNAVYVEATASEVTGAELERGIGLYNRGSVGRGLREWTAADVRAPARRRLFRATASEHFVLTTDDERIPVRLSR
jgi:Pyridoxamine 5'-phosphate oxidase